MNWDECVELLKEVHQEPIAPADYAAVRARVMNELARRARPWWSHGWVWGLAAAGVALLAVATNVDWRPRVEPMPVVALAHPAAPEVRKAARRPPIARETRKAKGEALLVRMLTDDPDVVIYWIAGPKGEDE